MALGGVGVGMVARRLASGIFLITRYSVTMSRIDRDMLNLLPHGVTFYQLLSKPWRVYMMVLKPKSRETIIAWSGIQGKADVKRGVMLDQLHADGYKYTDFISPKSAGSTCKGPETWEDTRTAVVMGFPKEKQQLWFASTKDLTEEQKLLRTSVVRDVGRKIDKIKQGLERRQVVKKPRQPKALQDSLRDNANKDLARLEKAENPTFDTVESTKHLKAYIKSLG